ncbi:hypothetical protein Mal15_01140 [Stieleria maiorica]|uniref:Uncharacterized protein n=1 Tax=Stieleria maiorica TaxID=2795974 RepID=A0A5B9M4D3_9BACT|nr:hypothetical protein [Stieleria maiorica]QEF96088.1 hypothetical protein Mal15_01140 [Stieleria maiorica]
MGTTFTGGKSNASDALVDTSRASVWCGPVESESRRPAAGTPLTLGQSQFVVNANTGVRSDLVTGAH